MREEEILDSFAEYAEENGGKIAANLLFRLMTALMNTGEAHVYRDEMMSSQGLAKIEVIIKKP